MASPHALSRGNDALSTSATRAPPRARTSAATVPAGPAPTTATSKCSATTKTSDIDGAFCGIVAPCAPTHLPPAPATAASPAACSPASRSATTAWRRCSRSGRTAAGAGPWWTTSFRASPRLILDVATGPAGVALQLASRTGAQVVGVDLTEAMIRQGKANVARAGAEKQVQVVLGKGEQLPFADATFDALTFTYLLRYVEDPAATLRELARVVRPGGTVANLEFLVPASRFWRFWWWGYTRLVLPLGGAVTGGREWFTVGRFLGPNISAHYRRYPAVVDGPGVARRRDRRRRGPDDEPRRRSRDVGQARRWLRLPAPPSTPRSAAGGATGGRSSTRPTRPGTSPTS